MSIYEAVSQCRSLIVLFVNKRHSVPTEMSHFIGWYSFARVHLYVNLCACTHIGTRVLAHLNMCARTWYVSKTGVNGSTLKRCYLIGNTCICTCVCMSVCACMCACACACEFVLVHFVCMCVCVYMYICIYVCVCVWVCVYIYIYIYCNVCFSYHLCIHCADIS